MKREFIYSKTETYSQADVDAILKQHAEFVSGGFKGYVSPEDHKKVADELKPFQAEKRNTHIKTLISGLTSDDRLNDTIALSGITAEDDDATIKSKVQATIKDRPYLQPDGMKAVVTTKSTINKPQTKSTDELEGL